MAVHLLFLAVETVSPGLSRSATIYSDCIGAMGRVANLPLYRIPSRCRHSDILKTIMVNCSNLSFHREYHHVAAHQDDHTRWEDLTRAACDSTGGPTTGQNYPTFWNLTCVAISLDSPAVRAPICE